VVDIGRSGPRSLYVGHVLLCVLRYGE